ncbi:MAG TPA: thioredoxin family protein [Dyella sp.]|uniref:thioredoxin family protein n=1 Tax=Dyella sp. TaxID=1869338 RepID=UPI002F92CD71
MKTRIATLFLGLLGLALTAHALAAEVPFNQQQFDQALAAGKPAVVYFHADWCPTCRAQQPIVSRLAKEQQFQPVTVFVADFDKESALKKSLRVAQQSTFVVFKQGHEVTRSTGQTQESAIRATFQSAL